MRDGLRQQVRTYLEDIELSPERLQALEAMQAEPVDAPHSNRYRLMAAVAMVLIAVAVSVFMFEHDPRPLSWQIAEDVAKNHFKQRPLEVRAQALEPMRAYFGELEFRLLDSDLIRSAGYTLRGGRYCSVLDVPAAQLRLSGDAGTPDTLYQVAYDSEQFGPVPDISQGEAVLTVQVRGVSVDIWQEKGLMFTLVRDEDAD